jgi:hypothetical protein
MFAVPPLGQSHYWPHLKSRSECNRADRDTVRRRDARHPVQRTPRIALRVRELPKGPPAVLPNLRKRHITLSDIAGRGRSRPRRRTDATDTPPRPNRYRPRRSPAAWPLTGETKSESGAEQRRTVAARGDRVAASSPGITAVDRSIPARARTVCDGGSCRVDGARCGSPVRSPSTTRQPRLGSVEMVSHA